MLVLIDKFEKVLKNVARSKRTITYSQLLKEVNLISNRKVPLKGKVAVFILSKNLQDVCRRSVKAGKPMLGAVAVSRKGYPSEGFFRLAQEIYGIQLKTDEDRRIFWQNELKKVFEEFGD